ncbi:acyl-CoA binding protein [Rhizophagus clarus]|uniref:Acyl-CoA binding protein n=1 Tax=Rhizophagus clarus TaxID=94130 RepID=A0A8H3QRF7_9GLOM|nr:acyl-CoA binding protein [Rhizophagus clarus]
MMHDNDIDTNNGNESEFEDYSTPTNDISPFTPIILPTQTTSSGHEHSSSNSLSQHDPNTLSEGRHQFITPPELVQYISPEDDIHFHRPSLRRSSTPPSSEEESTSNQPSLNIRIHNIEQTINNLQSSLITSRRTNEIEKALEKLQAEVAASHERIERLRKDLNEREKNKRSWSWFVRIITKHAIINSVILAIIFVTFALRRQSPRTETWLQRLLRPLKIQYFS